MSLAYPILFHDCMPTLANFTICLHLHSIQFLSISYKFVWKYLIIKWTEWRIPPIFQWHCRVNLIMICIMSHNFNKILTCWFTFHQKKWVFTWNNLIKFNIFRGRMGNVRGWAGPLPYPAWYSKQLSLQHQILTRMRALGMTPVLPGFAGHVPSSVKQLYPSANISRLGDWGKFNSTYCCTHFLDPNDPLFQVSFSGVCESLLLRAFPIWL